MLWRVVNIDQCANLKGSRNIQDSHIVVEGYLSVQDRHYLPEAMSIPWPSYSLQ